MSVINGAPNAEGTHFPVTTGGFPSQRLLPRSNGCYTTQQREIPMTTGDKKMPTAARLWLCFEAWTPVTTGKEEHVSSPTLCVIPFFVCPWFALRCCSSFALGLCPLSSLCFAIPFSPVACPGIPFVAANRPVGPVIGIPNECSYGHVCT